MNALSLRSPQSVIYGSVVLAAVLLAGAIFILPNQVLIRDAFVRAAKGAVSVIPAKLAPPPGANLTGSARLEGLASLFAAGERLQVSELHDLLSGSISKGDVGLLDKLVSKLEDEGEPSLTARTAYELLAAKRPAAARDFVERRPDRADPALWRLRLELRRSAQDTAGAEALLMAALDKRGSAPPVDWLAGAYELGRSDLLLTAAERGVIGRLDANTSLDLVQRAVAARQFDLIPRIDRAGTPAWRDANPWLAMTVARQTGQTDLALHYASLLPSGRDEAREAIILASGDKDAIRAMMLAKAEANPDKRADVAEQMLASGYRPDALSLLRQQASDQPPSSPAAKRLLFLMGPRPDEANLAWLRQRASDDPDWLAVYTERERPKAALAYVQKSGAQGPDQLLVRLRLANAAKDRTAAADALGKLLAGPPLTAAQARAATAQLPSGLPRRLVMNLAAARVAAGVALPSDRLDLAWDAWNRNDLAGASAQLQTVLKATPYNPGALQLMSNVAEKMTGKASARPWLERSLSLAPVDSQARLGLLERLGRTRDAIALAEKLRARSPNDRELTVTYARLLMADGKPGRARKVLKQ